MAPEAVKISTSKRSLFVSLTTAAALPAITLAAPEETPEEDQKKAPKKELITALQGETTAEKFLAFSEYSESQDPGVPVEEFNQIMADFCSHAANEFDIEIDNTKQGLDLYLDLRDKLREKNIIVSAEFFRNDQQTIYKLTGPALFRISQLINIEGPFDYNIAGVRLEHKEDIPAYSIDEFLVDQKHSDWAAGFSATLIEDVIVLNLRVIEYGLKIHGFDQESYNDEVIASIYNEIAHYLIEKYLPELRVVIELTLTFEDEEHTIEPIDLEELISDALMLTANPNIALMISSRCVAPSSSDTRHYYLNELAMERALEAFYSSYPDQDLIEKMKEAINQIDIPRDQENYEKESDLGRKQLGEILKDNPEAEKALQKAITTSVHELLGAFLPVVLDFLRAKEN